MSARDSTPAPGEGPTWGAAAQAMYRAAQAVARGGGPGLFDALVGELADILQADTVFVAVFKDEQRLELRTLAARLDGRPMRNFDYPLQGSPCAKVVGRSFRYVASGVAAEFVPGTIFGAKGMDSYAAFPLNDGAGTPLGLLVAMARQPVADAALAEALLKIFAGRIVAEIERGRADDALRASEQQYRAIFDSSADSMGLWDERLRLVDVNHAFTRISGWSRDDVIGQRLEERAGEPEVARRAALIRAALAGDEGRIEVQVPKKDGSRIEVETRYVPVAFGGRRYALSIARDITERQAALAALRAREEQYRAVFESTSDALVLWDRDLTVVDVNPAALQLYGYTREEVIGRGYPADRLPDDYVRERQDWVRRALAGETVHVETTARRVRGDGSSFEIELRVVPFRHRGELHALAVGRDITERKRAEQALRASEAQYRAIFNASADALILWDSRYRRVDVNPAYERLFGWRRDEVVGRSYDHFDDGEQYAQPRRELVRRALAGETCRAELASRRKDGSIVHIEVHATPFHHRGEPHALAIARDVTERKRAEAALRASEEQYRAVFDASTDALTLWDSRLRRVDVNPAYTRFFGWTRDEVIGRGFDFPVFSAEHQRAREELVRRALAGETVRAEHDVMSKGGERRLAEVHAIPFRHHGEPHALVITRDITDRKLAEEALRASEEQYRAIFDGSVDPMVLWSRSLHVVDVNAEFEHTTGMRRDEVVGRHWSERPDAAEMRRLLPAIERALGGELVHTVESVTRADGSPFDLELRYLPVRLAGEPFALGIGRDVTQRLERERQLQRSEARLRATVEAAFDCVIGMDGEGRIVEFNAAAERCFGHRREDVLGRLLADVILPHRHREAHARGLRHFHGSGGAPMVGRLVETTALRADGSEIPVELAISVAAVPEGNIFVGHLRDIGARRAAEAERAALEAQLRQAQKMETIGQLTGGIAHDFNNILTSVIGYLVLGLERAQALHDDRLVRQLGQAQLAAQRARDLIAQMLAFARRQRGERKAVSLPELVRQSLQLLRPTMPATIVLDALALDALPAAALPPVHADAVQIEQVLFNLCINARDAMEGSGAIRVRLALWPGGAAHCAGCGDAVAPGRWVEIGVADTGSGIAPDVRRRIFEPFFTTKEVGRGSGMGLAMVHGIVHEHGGHVVVDSEPGRGSLFRVLLPAADALAEAAGAAPGEARAADARLSGRVLVVEDEVMVGDFMAELLEGWGLQVVLLRDPASALAWLEDGAHRPELLVTDQTMPQMTGCELAARCATLRPALPVLLYTGNPDAVDPRALERGGVRAVLGKPVEPAALRAAIERCLAASRGG